jgi:hypothetical protein
MFKYFITTGIVLTQVCFSSDNIDTDASNKSSGKIHLDRHERFTATDLQEYYTTLNTADHKFQEEIEEDKKSESILDFIYRHTIERITFWYCFSKQDS